MKILLFSLFLVFAGISAQAQYPLYHRISDTAGAMAEAQARHLPIAYLGVTPSEMARPKSLTMYALSNLQGGAVVICFDGSTVARITPMVRDQYGFRDDGDNLGTGNTWIAPRVVFTDPGVTKILHRVPSTMLQANPQAIFQAMDHIHADPNSLIPAPLPLAVSTPMVNGYPLFHNISDTAAAQAEAMARKLPLAYLGAHDGYLTLQSPTSGSEQELTQMALEAMQGKAVVIYFEGSNMAPVPMLVHMQFHVHDDGELTGGASWLVPKVVFADPSISKTLGRVSSTQMKADGESDLISTLASINGNSTSLVASPSAASTSSTSAPSSKGFTMPSLNSFNGETIMAQFRVFVIAWTPYVVEHQTAFGIGVGIFILFAIYRIGGKIFGSD